MKGTVESTGAAVQGRTSFLASEIHWNHVFEPLIDPTINSSKTTIDFSKFNQIRPIINTKDATEYAENETKNTKHKEMFPSLTKATSSISEFCTVNYTIQSRRNKIFPSNKIELISSQGALNYLNEKA